LLSHIPLESLLCIRYNDIIMTITSFNSSAQIEWNGGN
jgi:hypothetical protein